MTTIGYVHADVRDPAVGADLLRRNAAELDDIAAALSAGTPVPPGRLYLLAHNLRNHADALGGA